MLNINQNSYLTDELLLSTCEFEGDGIVENLAVYLKCKAPFIHEGEIALILKLNDRIQYTLSFTYILNNAIPTFFIGGLQGGKPEDTSVDKLRKLTKQLHGLIPKQLMIHVISAMVEFYQVNSLIGVSNINHAFQSSRRKSKRERVKANLDDFWLNFNATLEQDGNYRFLPISNVINLEEIQSKKRSQYRKRQMILDVITQQCKKSLNIISKK